MDDRDRILLVDDDEATLTVLETFLREEGYAVTTATNGREALEKLGQERYLVVITDLGMPVMDGGKLIKEIAKMKQAPLVIVLTGYNDADLVVKLMKQGVYDYIVKPVDHKDFVVRTDRAVKEAKLKMLKAVAEQDRYKRLEDQLEWYRFHERLTSDIKKMENTNLFENLHRSLSQGSGLGTLLTLFDFLLMTAVEKEHAFEVEKELFLQIKGNMEEGYKAIRVFSQIEDIRTSTVDLKEVGAEHVYKLVGTAILGLKEKAAINKHKVILSDYKTQFAGIKLKVNDGYLNLLFEEIILNALKYSAPSTSVMVLADIDSGDFKISVINIPRKENKDGVPMEYEQYVFEPFVRIDKYIQDQYKSLDYGLGLTLVEKIVEKHNGKVYLHNITDYSDFEKSGVMKVICSVILPAVAEENK